MWVFCFRLHCLLDHLGFRHIFLQESNNWIHFRSSWSFEQRFLISFYGFTGPLAGIELLRVRWSTFHFAWATIHSVAIRGFPCESYKYGKLVLTREHCDIIKYHKKAHTGKTHSSQVSTEKVLHSGTHNKNQSGARGAFTVKPVTLEHSRPF